MRETDHAVTSHVTHTRSRWLLNPAIIASFRQIWTIYIHRIRQLRLDNEPTINKQNLIDITDVPTPCLNSYPPPGLNGFKLGACLSVIKSKDIVAEVTIIMCLCRRQRTTNGHFNYFFNSHSAATLEAGITSTISARGFEVNPASTRLREIQHALLVHQEGSCTPLRPALVLIWVWICQNDGLP